MGEDLYFLCFKYENTSKRRMSGGEWEAPRMMMALLAMMMIRYDDDGVLGAVVIWRTS